MCPTWTPLGHRPYAQQHLLLLCVASRRGTLMHSHSYKNTHNERKRRTGFHVQPRLSTTRGTHVGANTNGRATALAVAQGFQCMVLPVLDKCMRLSVNVNDANAIELPLETCQSCSVNVRQSDRNGPLRAKPLLASSMVPAYNAIQEEHTPSRPESHWPALA